MPERAPSNTTISVAIFIFPDVEVLDFAGPYEVFTTASRVSKMMDSSATPPFTVFTIAQNEGSLRARAGLTVIPDHTFANHPAIDLLIIPGGVVSAQLQNPAIAEWIKRTAPTTELTASVCNGASLLAQAGLLDGRRCTTHWSDVDDLKKMCPSLTVLEQTRWVDEGSIVTSGGISAGIDMCLHLVERLASRELAVATARRMEFNWCEHAAP
jgi:transcriptional regulator GlxA family with amidase domain